MDRRIIVWNCRGAGSECFVRSARLIVGDLKPDILVLLETRVDAGRASNICKRIGFSEVFAVHGNGFAGGIWVAWNKETVNVRIIEEFQQFCHVEICFQNKDRVLTTFVYASPNEEVKRNW